MLLRTLMPTIVWPDVLCIWYADDARAGPPATGDHGSLLPEREVRRHGSGVSCIGKGYTKQGCAYGA